MNIFKRIREIFQQDYLSLEELLQKAADEPAYRAEFYKKLLFENLFAIVRESDLQPGRHVLKEKQKVKIATHLDGKVLVFTSPQRFFDRGVIKEEVKYLRAPSKLLFKLTKGAILLLNPYSDYGTELLPTEIEAILNGTIFTAPETIIKEGGIIHIGQPANYPTKAVNSLKLLFSRKPNVKAAYLGWIFDPSSNDPPHYILALKCDSDSKNVIGETIFTAKETLKPGEIIDVVSLKGPGLDDSFVKSMMPFYKKI